MNDEANNRIMVYNVGTSTIQTTSTAAFNYIGPANFTSAVTAATTQSGLSLGAGFDAFDPTSRHLFIMDTGNNRIIQDI